ncbi:MAG TPA: O-antigen ligase family protein [Candidatus Saccharimonadales bacterium]|nr:O-antigen ligase family protein [Candidatus Saccharimonadales bacterium]
MKASISPRQATAANWLVAVVLAGIPFHAFLTVFGASLVGRYTLLRLWDDVLLLLLAGLVGYWLVMDRALRKWFTTSLLVRLIAAYAGLTLLLGVVSYARGDVSVQALGYGGLVNLRFFVWFLAVLLTARQSPWLQRHWRYLVLIPAALVGVFAVLQYTILPHDFLVHFGYHAGTTIPPIETINHNTHYIRVQSTLRGANPLGAYLVVIVSVLAVWFWHDRRWAWAGALGVIVLAALYASGSRSAWIGTVLGLAIIACCALKTRRARLITGATSLVILAAGASLLLVLRGNATLQNELLHTQTHSAIKTTSNAAHASALRTGLRDVLRQPFGDGPGTAGPASEHNTRQPERIAENYYIQIAQEVGWLGLALFVTILVLVGLELLAAIGASPLGLAVFASFIGLVFVNLLSHAWTDDTLAFVWWGLAGIALGSLPVAKSAVGGPAKKVAK